MYMECERMVKIKISYERPEDLQLILDKLGENVKRIKEPKQQEGPYRRAYIELKEAHE